MRAQQSRRSRPRDVRRRESVTVVDENAQLPYLRRLTGDVGSPQNTPVVQPALVFSTIVKEDSDLNLEFDKIFAITIIMSTVVPPEICSNRLIVIVSGGFLGFSTEIAFKKDFFAYSEFNTRAKIDNTHGSETSAALRD